MDKIVVCRTCGKMFTGERANKELALHIIINKQTHRVTIWTRRVASDERRLNRKLSNKEHNYTPPTADEVKIKEDSRRRLSGRKILVPVVCPKCKMGSRQQLETEHTNNPQAWRIGLAFVKICLSCGGA